MSGKVHPLREEQALAVNPARNAVLKGAQVILVDDVLTSGATSEACVRTLKRAGASKVIVASAR